jgi:hypothetical protein
VSVCVSPTSPSLCVRTSCPLLLCATTAVSCLSLLQPIPEVYALFDNVMLMQDGYNVYSGPRDGQ